MNRCRVCGNDFFETPLLHFQNMPAAAQFLPDNGSVGKDRGIELEICQCSGCGLVQLGHIRPVPYYREVIRASGLSEEMTRFRQRQFADFIDTFSLRGKKILEVGCGRGEFLSLMNRFEVEASGLEYSRPAVQACNGAGLRVEHGFLEQAGQRLEHAPFDAFFILNFLEHLPDPNATLRALFNNLAEEAVGLVEVPNFDMILRQKLFSEFTRDHLFYFTRETLGHVLQRNGFEVIECTEIWYKYILSATVRKRAATDANAFREQQKQLQREIDHFLQRFAPKRVAVWGAGHQALAVLSLADLGDRIKYVVDSAPFKQGKFTPATHIPIVAPDRLENDPVDGIMVMAAGYSDEVAGIIRRRFGPEDLAVAILREYGLVDLVDEVDE